MKKSNQPRLIALSSIFLCTFFITTCRQSSTDSNQSELPDGDFPYCVHNKGNTLCSTLPHDVLTQFGFDYFNLDSTPQAELDIFSWQTFIGLNWPALVDGMPDTSVIIGDAPKSRRVWEFYPTTGDVFPGQKTIDCSNDEDLPVFRLSAKSVLGNHRDNPFLESTGQPLIDRNGNFILYDIRLNDLEAEWIRGEGLNTIAGQKARTDSVAFPVGWYANNDNRTGGRVGAMEIKTSWMILDDTATHSDYFVMDAHVHIDSSDVEGGNAPLCFKATLGLVGMHILRKTRGPYRMSMGSGTLDTTNVTPQYWIWTSFEHTRNAPLAANPQDPTQYTVAITSCDPPTDISTPYNLFDPDCQLPNGEPCPTNTAPAKPYLWSTSPPFASSLLVNGTFGTQVVRCFDLYSSTKAVNKRFQEKLVGTVWENYMLIGTQWQGDPATSSGKPVPGSNGNLPRYFSNTTLETYIQLKDFGSCISCHQDAKLAGNSEISANFSYLLQLEVTQ